VYGRCCIEVEKYFIADMHNIYAVYLGILSRLEQLCHNGSGQGTCGRYGVTAVTECLQNAHKQYISVKWTCFADC
jgi:hypothetical protein